MPHHALAANPPTHGAELPIIVVGAGPGGYVAAIRLAQKGLKVVLVEAQALGGTCLNWGCIPSKALIHAAHSFAQLQPSGPLAAMGITLTAPATLDWPATQQWKNSVVGKLRGGIETLLKRHGVQVVQGHAHFMNEDTLHIIPTHGGEAYPLQGHAVVLAPGAKAVHPKAWQVCQQRIVTAQGLFVLPQLPKRWAVLGAGVIGLELGGMLRQLGCEVSVVDQAPSLLPNFDAALAQGLHKALVQQGVRFHLGVSVEGDVKAPAQPEEPVTLTLTKEASAPPETLTVDAVLVATGRVPNTEPLQLAAGNVAVDETGRILVNAQYQSTTNPKVFAIGDAVAGPQLAHKASREGLFVADVLAGDTLALADWVAMPSVVYTTPEAATVGLTVAQAEAQGLVVKHSQVPLAALGRAHTMQQAQGGWVQLVVCAHSNKLLGAQVLAPHAGDLIAELTLAIEAGLQAEDVALTVHAHPTLSEAWAEAAEALHQQAIHWYQPKAQ